MPSLNYSRAFSVAPVRAQNGRRPIDYSSWTLSLLSVHLIANLFQSVKERIMVAQKILVVDDSPTDLKLVSGPLRTQGYQVITAIDGEEALEKAAREHPELIVLDIILPKKNGFQVCRQLKTSTDTKDIKILMLSSKTQDSDRF